MKNAGYAMNENELNSLKENEGIKLNYARASMFKGRFNTYDIYSVKITRVGKTIYDDNGAQRFLHDIYKYFHRANKWN